MRFAIRYEFIAKQPIFDNRKHVKPGCKRTLGSSRDDVARISGRRCLAPESRGQKDRFAADFINATSRYAAMQRIQIIGVATFSVAASRRRK